MARVVLHIGTHKTATTTIQDTFAQNTDLLAQHGMIYPLLGAATGHHGLVMDWSDSLPISYVLEQTGVETLQQIAAAHGSGDHTVFLSSEEMSRANPASRPDLTAMRDALAGFDRIEVVCVLREQWQFVQSVYLEVSKSRMSQRPPQLVDTVLLQDMVEGLWTDYNLLYDHLLQTFAPDQITFLDFDHCRKAPGGMLGAMLTHLGVALDPAALVAVNDGRSNTSPGALPTLIVNTIANTIQPPPWMIAAVTEVFAAQFGAQARSVMWSRAECRALIGYAARCNRRLTERLAPWQADFALTASHIDAIEGLFREDLPTAFWAAANEQVTAALERRQAS